MEKNFAKYYDECEKFKKTRLYKYFLSVISFIESNTDKYTYSYEIESKYNLKGSEVRQIIRYARRLGFFICLSENGYYMTDSREEFIYNMQNFN